MFGFWSLAAALFLGLAPVHGVQRAVPPPRVSCERNHLTSFTGHIIIYRRQTGRISLRVRTDDATTENFVLKLQKAQDGSQHFLLRGEPFKPSDWAVIEELPGRLRPKMRVIVWVCDDGSKPVFDWRPVER